MQYIALSFLLGLVFSANAALIEGRVVGIADGDTITVLDSSFKQHKIRLAEIDAPESSQPFGRQSKASLSQLCFERKAKVIVQDTDRYQRLVGRVECDGRDVNLAQVVSGYAWVYDKYARDAMLKKAQSSAKLARAGLWSEPNPTPPWEFRREKH